MRAPVLSGRAAQAAQGGADARSKGTLMGMPAVRGDETQPAIHPHNARPGAWAERVLGGERRAQPRKPSVPDAGVDDVRGRANLATPESVRAAAAAALREAAAQAASEEGISFGMASEPPAPARDQPWHADLRRVESPIDRLIEGAVEGRPTDASTPVEVAPGPSTRPPRPRPSAPPDAGWGEEGAADALPPLSSAMASIELPDSSKVTQLATLEGPASVVAPLPGATGARGIAGRLVGGAVVLGLLAAAVAYLQHATAPAADEVPVATGPTADTGALPEQPAATAAEALAEPEAEAAPAPDAPAPQPAAQEEAVAEAAEGQPANDGAEAAAQADLADDTEDDAEDDAEARAPTSADRAAALVEARAMVDQATYLRSTGKLDRAIEQYERALERYRPYPRALAGIVRIHLARQEAEPALRQAKRLVRMVPRRASHQLLLGDAYALSGDNARAREAWQRAASYGSAPARARLEAAP